MNETFEQIFDLLMHLGNLYETAFDINTNGNELLDDLLTKYLGDPKKNGSYDITGIMKMVCNY